MSRDLPSLNAVRMFEAAARLENFTKAAEVLYVTQGAVSRQIKRLEYELGCQLFHRDGPSLKLTDVGARFYESITEGLNTIRRGVVDLRQASSSPSLTVSVLPSFAAKWLVPRLAGFQPRHNPVEVRIIASYEAVDFSTRPDIDAAIRWGRGNWPGIHSECLLTERLFPVCSPGFLRKHPRPRSPSELARLPLIRPVKKYDQWADWFELAETEPPAPSGRVRYSDSLLLQQAALEGQGVALARSLLVADELKSGRLIRLFDLSIPSANNFYIVCPVRKTELETVHDFLEWLRKEASQSEYACEDVVLEHPRRQERLGAPAQ